MDSYHDRQCLGNCCHDSSYNYICCISSSNAIDVVMIAAVMIAAVMIAAATMAEAVAAAALIAAAAHSVAEPVQFSATGSITIHCGRWDDPPICDSGNKTYIQ